MKVIGLMSGTSTDGIDSVLLEIVGQDWDIEIKLLAGETYPYSVSLQEQILKVISGESISMAELAQLDDAIAEEFAHSAIKIQQQESAELIGSHGQTVFHRPPKRNGTRKSHYGYTLQLGRGDLMANLTGIPTVSNFRAADIAAGGEGAPLVSKVDICLLNHPHKHRCIQNIGGIGNLTYIPAKSELKWMEGVMGWDTGPGNSLLDLAVQKLTNNAQSYDQDGEWAAQGTPNQSLVNHWLEHEFFAIKPPKSTGRELFGLNYMNQCYQDAVARQLSPQDWLASLTELTVASIVKSYKKFLPQMPDEVLICGGGSHNLYLKQRLQDSLAGIPILTTDEVGLSGSFKEAIAFGVLAYWRYICSFCGNHPQVTGAKHPALLGEIHLPIGNKIDNHGDLNMLSC